MATSPITCATIAAAVEQAIHTGDLSVLPAEAFGHVANCSQCRAALLLLMRALDLAPEVQLSELICVRVRADLAAYIDLQQRDPAAATANYPHVWWHLWFCPECAATYEATMRLLDAARRGEIDDLGATLRRP